MNIPNFVLFYDGECGLCNRSVQFVLDHEKDSLLKFSSLQSDFAQKIIGDSNCTDFGDSMLLYFKGKIYSKSSAALLTIVFLKWYMKPLLIFWLIPAFLRNGLYDLVARNRKKYFSSCLISSKRGENRFLN